MTRLSKSGLEYPACNLALKLHRFGDVQECKFDISVIEFRSRWRSILNKFKRNFILYLPYVSLRITHTCSQRVNNSSYLPGTFYTPYYTLLSYFPSLIFMHMLSHLLRQVGVKNKKWERGNPVKQCDFDPIILVPRRLTSFWFCISD